ncbi:MAG: WYL domain-containing protein [Firmicutes bacterium]|nr:WYL domain-containing protein [Bacillota bacterium]
MHKIERMMGIILSLNKNEKMTAKELANKFEVDIRTIYRDIQALGEMNIPIYSELGNKGGYSLLDEYFIPPIRFNKDEIFSLLLSEKLIQEIRIPGYSKYINSAFLKLKNIVNDEFLNELEDIKNKIKFAKSSKSIPLTEFQYFDVIKNGLENNIKIKIAYLYKSKTYETTIHPYGFVYIDDVWFVVSFKEDEEIIESIPIHIIVKAEIKNAKFKTPTDFDIDLYYCKNHCIVNCKGLSYTTIELKVNKKYYHKIKDYIFFNEAKVKEFEDFYLFTLKTKNPNGYVSLAFRFFNEIEISKPDWLREEFIKQLHLLNDKYKI